MTKPRVLIIDDDGSYLELLAEALNETFDVVCSTSIDGAREIIKTQQLFDIALVDEYIGKEKGSSWIKSCVDDNTAAESFVLYSGMATDEAILKGLECGADDFLAKPISLLTLSNKLEKIITYQNKIHGFENEIHSKDRVINISMAQAAKYGSCMQLSSRLNHCFSIEQIRDEIFSYLYSMDLRGCIGFYPLNQPPIFYSAENGFCSPVEIGVMKLLKIKPRLYRFGTRTIFNHSLVSILILNLEDGAIDTDIFIDALASVIECIGARMAFITYKESLVKVQSHIEEAVIKTKEMIEVSKRHQQDVMGEIVQNIGMSFHVLDLSEDQEEYLTNLVHNVLKRHAKDDVNFLEISSLLDNALDKVGELDVLNSEQEQSMDLDEEDELF